MSLGSDIFPFKFKRNLQNLLELSSKYTNKYSYRVENRLKELRKESTKALDVFPRDLEKINEQPNINSNDILCLIDKIYFNKSFKR
jgi:hypothetical protein